MKQCQKTLAVISIKNTSKIFYNFAIGVYILHMAVMANLTMFYPDVLLRFRMPSFVFVAGLAIFAVSSRMLQKELPIRTITFFLIFFLFTLLSAFHGQENVVYIKEYLFTGFFVKYVFLFSILFFYEDEPDLRIRQLTVIAIAALLVYRLGVLQGMFLDEKGRMEYMTVGYGSAPWWVIIVQGVFYYKSKLTKGLCLIASIYFAVFIAFYGNRGALLVLFLSLIIFLVAYLPLKQIILLGPLSVILLGGLFLCLEPILLFFSRVFTVDLGASRNFWLLASGRLGYDSGRFPIYQDCWNAVLDSPLLGNGVGGDRIASATGSWAHNIVLELCVDFGVIVGLLIYCWLLYIGFYMLFRCKHRAWKALFLPFYVYSMVFNFFSGTLYESGYLLASVVIYFTYITYIRKCRMPLMHKSTYQSDGACNTHHPLY